MRNNSPQMGLTEWSMLITLSILWGGSFFLVEVALTELPPFTVVAARSSLAAVVLVSFIALSGRTFPRQWSIWAAFFVMGVFNNAIPFSLIVWGQTQIASGLAAILNATSPLFILVAAHYLTHDEKITNNKVIGLIIGFLGVAVIVGIDYLTALGSNIWGQVAVIIAAMSYALAAIFGKRFAAMGIKPMVLAMGQVTCSSLILLPMAFIFESPMQLSWPSDQVLWSLLTLGILSTVVAYRLYFGVLQRAGATNALLVTLLIPMTAILLGYLFLDERLLSNHFMGMTMIMIGLLIIDGRLIKYLKSRN